MWQTRENARMPAQGGRLGDLHDNRLHQGREAHEGVHKKNIKRGEPDKEITDGCEETGFERSGVTRNRPTKTKEGIMSPKKKGWGGGAARESTLSERKEPGWKVKKGGSKKN